MSDHVQSPSTPYCGASSTDTRAEQVGGTSLSICVDGQGIVKFASGRLGSICDSTPDLVGQALWLGPLKALSPRMFDLPRASDAGSLAQLIRCDPNDLFPEAVRIRRIDTGSNDDVFLLEDSGVLEPERAQELSFHAMLRDALDSLSAHVVILDRTGTIVAVNDAWRRFSLQSKSRCHFAFLGWNYLEVCDDSACAGSSDAGRVAEGIRRLLRGDESAFDMDYECSSPEAERWYHMRATSHHGEGPGRVVISHEDVTQRVLASESLRKNRTLLRTVLDLLPVGVLITDPAGRIVDHNPAAERIWSSVAHVGPDGYDQFRACWTETGHKIEPQDWALARALIKKEAYLEEMIDVVTGDGVTKTILNSAIPMLGADQDVLGGIVIHQDITLRRQFEQTLAEKEMRLRTILESAGLGMCGINPEGCLTFASSRACEMLAVDSTHVPGARFEELLAGSDQQRWSEVMESLFRGDSKEQTLEARIVNEGTSTVVLEIVARPIQAQSQVVSEVVVSISDVTERRVTYQQRVQAQKLEAIGQLASGIAHEINSPMQYIGDNTLFLADAFGDCLRVLVAARTYVEDSDKGDGEALRVAVHQADLDYLMGEVPQAIQQSLDGIERVTKIVYSMKQFAHPDQAGKSPEDLNRIVTSSVTVCRNVWKYVADLDLDLAPDLPLVPCFPGDLGQVVLNLVVNASHAIESAIERRLRTRGQIRITTRVARGGVELSVADTGTGIPDGLKLRVFEPFFTTKDVGKGTGQGLPLVHRIMTEKHGGTVTFESTEDEGTTFYVWLPL